jgi:hypothetical protein
MMRFEDHISPEVLLFTGVLVLPAFLFTSSLPVKTVLAAAYIILTVFGGRSFKILPNVIVAVGIVAANLITPFGKILFQIGTFRITEGAFRLGALKAATLIGLIYLSRLTVRSSLRFPGRFGELLALTLFYFERITERKMRLSPRDFWKNLDDLLRDVYEGAAASEVSREKSPAGSLGYASAAAFVLINWLLFALGN